MSGSSEILERAVLEDSGTVTHFLEALTGEPLVADVVWQGPSLADADNELGVIRGHSLTHRIAILKGSTSDLRYLYAESSFVPERLADPVRTRLESTSDPIGRVLGTQGMRLIRQPLITTDATVDATVGHRLSMLSGLVAEIVWSRRYLLTVDGLPLFKIQEWFLRPVLDAMNRRAQI